MRNGVQTSNEWNRTSDCSRVTILTEASCHGIHGKAHNMHPACSASHAQESKGRPIVLCPCYTNITLVQLPLCAFFHHLHVSASKCLFISSSSPCNLASSNCDAAALSSASLQDVSYLIDLACSSSNCICTLCSCTCSSQRELLRYPRMNASSSNPLTCSSPSP